MDHENLEFGRLISEEPFVGKKAKQYQIEYKNPYTKIIYYENIEILLVGIKKYRLSKDIGDIDLIAKVMIMMCGVQAHHKIYYFNSQLFLMDYFPKKMSLIYEKTIISSGLMSIKINFIENAYSLTITDAYFEFRYKGSVHQYSLHYKNYLKIREKMILCGYQI